MAVVGYRYLGYYRVKQVFAVGDGEHRVLFQEGDTIAKLRREDNNEVYWFHVETATFISDHPIFNEFTERKT